MSNRDTRIKLFDSGSSELALLRPEAAGRYCCPLCLNLFRRDEADQLLTLEHIIPNGLGRRLPALTCKPCNNEVGGAKLDAHLHKKLAMDSFLKGTGKHVAAEITVGGHRVAVNWERIAGGDGIKNNFRIVGKATSPRAEEGSKEALLRMTEGNELNVTFSIASERRVNVALLKSAYLLGFKELGYRFILHENLTSIRQQIRAPLEELIPIDALVVGLTNPEAANFVMEITEPTNIGGILVALELRSPDGSVLHRGVLLPTPASPAEFFERARAIKQGGNRVEFGGRRVRSARP